MIRVLHFPSRETHIPSDSVPLTRKFSRDMCFLGRGTHITRHMWGGGEGKKNEPTNTSPLPQENNVKVCLDHF